ncbi:MAG: hypothetical protein M1490_02090 [Candidatus Bathyarchaeota archaeon]|nr:hypothetical protein [Candidatus Bathyarchaeota archaeon]
MDRNEAVTYLKELLNLCSDMSPESMSFETPTNSDSVGYRVHIKGKIHDIDRQRVKDVAKKYNLVVKEDSDGVVVYKLR